VTARWDRRSLDEQTRVADLTLSTWGPAVAEASAYWRRWVEELGLAAGDLGRRENLHRLVSVRARDLLADAPGGASTVLRPTERQAKAHGSTETLTALLRAIRRDGPDGKREAMLREFRPLQLHRAGDLLVASTRSDLDRMHRAGARTAEVLGLRDDDVVLGAVPAGPTLAWFGSQHLAAGASLPALHAFGVTVGSAADSLLDDRGGGLAEVAAVAHQLPATVIVVRLEDAVELAGALGDERVDLGALRRVVVVGPPPDDDTRGAIAGAYATAGASVDVRAVWGPAAGRVLWAECAAGSGLHTYPDLELLEVVDPFTGQPTDADGDLTLTTLGWHGTVLLRLQTGAWVDPLATGPCPSCKRTVPRLTGTVVPDAWELGVRDERGRATTVDLRGVAMVLSSTPGVEAWRAELRPGTAGDDLLVEVAGAIPGDARHRLAARVAGACGLEPTLVLDADASAVEEAVAEAGGVFVDQR
jgi:hypothetical protein